MTRFFLRTLLARIRAGKSLYLLTVGGVALGVASVLCIQIINQNSLAAFVGSVKAVSGDADFSIFGRTPTLREEIFPEVLAEAGVAVAWPLYRVDVSLAADPETFLEVVGIDLFAAAQMPLKPVRSDPEGGEHGKPSRSPADPQSGSLDAVLARAMTTTGWVAVTPAMATEMGWQEGDTVRVSSGSRTAELIVGALVDFQAYAPLASRKLAVMDIAQVQGLLGQPGRLHQIDVRLAPDAVLDEVTSRLLERLGPTVRVVTPEQREQDAAGLLASFRLNLTALSLISLFVGIFLVYSSVQASLVRQRAEFGLIRSLGASTRQVLALILAEAVLLGLVGTVIGLPLGYWVATRNVHVVSATLSNIYLLQEIDSLRLSATLYLLAVVIGIGGALAGAALPAVDISRRDTHSLLAAFTLHERTRHVTVRLAVTAVALALITLGWFLVWGRDVRWSGFLLAFMTMVALPLLTPLFIRLFCGWLPVSGIGFAYSLKNLMLRLQTTAVALAALAVAVSMLVGITLLIGSFRSTLETWIEGSVRADVYITTQSWVRGGQEAVLESALLDSLRADPAVESSEWLRQLRVQTGERWINFAGLAMDHRQPRYRRPLLVGEIHEVFRRLRQQGAVLISEPLARKESLAVGDSLAVVTPAGVTHLAIAGISYDYSNESGSALVHLSTLERLFGPGPVNNLALYLHPGEDVEKVVDRFRARFRHWPLVIRSNQRLRTDILDIFDQTFAITRILQAMALLIATSGISLTLIILARERVAELALYRSLGALRRQIFRIFLGEGLGLGLLGLGLGLAGGTTLAAILIFLINRAYFGWTIRPAWPGGALLQEMVTILAAAVLASIYPAVRASRTPARELSREDL